MSGLPASGAAGRPALAAGVDALGLHLDDGQIDRLLAYVELLSRWNRVYNLTAVRDPDEMLRQHLLDCLAVVGPLQRRLSGRPGRLLDVGSGGGLPGLVLAIAMPALQVTCVDTVAKKVSFVRQAAAELGLRQLQATHGRVEQLAAAAGFDIVTSRAFASLADFVHLTRPLLDPAGAWMAMKGRPPTDEIAALPPAIEVFHVEPLAVPGLAAERCLVWMRPSAAVGA